MRRVYRWACMLLLGAQHVTCFGASAAPEFPLSVSRVTGALLDAQGTQVFLNGEAAWSLLVAADRRAVLTYLDDRRARGFNAVIVNLIEHHFGGPVNAEGNAPFLEPGRFDRPNEAYFRYVDWVLERARERGFVVVLAPAYIGFACSDQGWCRELRKSSLESLREYGRYLGRRYADAPNVIWMHGGDADARAYGLVARVNAIAESIRAESGDRHLHTAHCARGRTGRDCYLAPWLKIDTVYADCRSTLRMLRDSRRSRPASVPFIYIEGTYENAADADEICVRAQAYLAWLAGAAGHFFGNESVWRFAPGWMEELDSPGARSMSVFANIVGRLPGRCSEPVFADSTDATTMIAAHCSDRLVVYARGRRMIPLAEGWPRARIGAIDGVDPASGASYELKPDNGVVLSPDQRESVTIVTKAPRGGR